MDIQFDPFSFGVATFALAVAIMQLYWNRMLTLALTLALARKRNGDRATGAPSAVHPGTEDVDSTSTSSAAASRPATIRSRQYLQLVLTYLSATRL
jgi:hypothetical protein